MRAVRVVGLSQGIQAGRQNLIQRDTDVSLRVTPEVDFIKRIKIVFY